MKETEIREFITFGSEGSILHYLRGHTERVRQRAPKERERAESEDLGTCLYLGLQVECFGALGLRPGLSIPTKRAGFS